MTLIEYAQILSAFLVPTIAIVGMFLGIFNYRLAVNKRNDELFDRRFKFYKKLENYWLSTGRAAQLESRDPEVDIEVLISFAAESQFLFGSDISEHIVSLDKNAHQGSLMFPNSDFTKPFEKYINFR